MEVSRDLKISIITEGKGKKTRQKREREYKGEKRKHTQEKAQYIQTVLFGCLGSKLRKGVD